MSGTILPAARNVYIGIGSNLGEPLQNCLRAIRLVDGLDGCRVKRTSRFYRTEPVGGSSQNWYVNAVIRMETSLGPHELMRSLLAVESEMGRVRREKWEARVIDLDILLYGDAVIREEDLTVPHPLMHERRFVLLPLVDLDPERLHPVLGKSMARLLEESRIEGQAVILMSDICSDF